MTHISSLKAVTSLSKNHFWSFQGLDNLRRKSRQIARAPAFWCPRLHCLLGFLFYAYVLMASYELCESFTLLLAVSQTLSHRRPHTNMANTPHLTLTCNCSITFIYLCLFPTVVRVCATFGYLYCMARFTFHRDVVLSTRIPHSGWDGTMGGSGWRWTADRRQNFFQDVSGIVLSVFTLLCKGTGADGRHGRSTRKVEPANLPYWRRRTPRKRSVCPMPHQKSIDNQCLLLVCVSVAATAMKTVFFAVVAIVFA